MWIKINKSIYNLNNLVEITKSDGNELKLFVGYNQNYSTEFFEDKRDCSEKFNQIKRLLQVT